MRTSQGRLPKPRMPKVGHPTGRFTQHRRIDKLRMVLEKAPLGLTLEEIAATLAVTQRSVRRYLAELDAATDLESVKMTPGGAHRWRIKPSERGRTVQLRRAQAYALLSTRRALEVLKGSALYDEVDLALSHIGQVAQTPFRAQGRAQIAGDQNLESRFFWLPPTCRSYTARGEELDELFRAVADLRVLRYRPRSKPGEARAERVSFHPYAMVVHKGAIVILGARAENARSDAPRVDVVPIEQMSDVRASEDEHFDLPGSFTIDDYVHGEFGVAQPTRSRFIVELDARVADEVRTRKLHPQQRVATSPDGRVRVSLPLVDVPRAIAWVLAWGDAARVVEPPELVKQVAEALARTAARYASTAG